MASKSKFLESVYRVRDKIGLLEAPLSVQWISTHKCNLNCGHCMVNAGNPLPDELNMQEIKKAIDDMFLMGVKQFIVTGGEPLLRKDIFEILSYAKERNQKIGLATNSSLVSRYSSQLQKQKLDAVMVSLDGLEKNHKKIRGNDSNFRQVIESIKFFKKIRVPKVSVCTTVNRFNIDELEQLKQLIFSTGANQWHINITMPEGRAKNKEEFYLTKAQMQNLIQFIINNKKRFRIDICSEAGYLGEMDKKLRGNSFFCSCGWTSCAIMANGDVMACPIFEKNNFIEGNIRKKSFRAIWDDGLNKFRNMNFNGKCDSCRDYSKCRGGCKVMRILGADCLKV